MSELTFKSIFKPLFFPSSYLSTSITIFFALRAKLLGTPPVILVSSLDPKEIIKSEF